MKVGDRVRFRDGLCGETTCPMAEKTLVITRYDNEFRGSCRLHELKPLDGEYNGLCNGYCSGWEDELELVEVGDSNAKIS